MWVYKTLPVRGKPLNAWCGDNCETNTLNYEYLMLKIRVNVLSECLEWIEIMSP